MSNLILSPLNASYASSTFFVALHHSGIFCITHAFGQIAVVQVAVTQIAVAQVTIARVVVPQIAVIQVNPSP